jgi:transcriptional regulator with GAF, ATPase, and Fis domain
MQQTLEKVLKQKVQPIIDEAMHKYLGITVSEVSEEISDKIEKSPLLSYEINTALSFKAAKKLFKKEFLTRMLQSHYGNVAAVARITGLNRRSVHRAIIEFRISVSAIRKEMRRMDYTRREAVDSILKKTLDKYRKIIRPSRLESMYRHVDKLSEEIVNELPAIDMTWKQAEREFEKAFIKKALEESSWSIAKAAKKIRLRYETLHRKIKSLGIEKA